MYARRMLYVDDAPPVPVVIHVFVFCCGSSLGFGFGFGFVISFNPRWLFHIVATPTATVVIGCR